MIEFQGENKNSADILKCAQNILNSVQGTVPYMRDMGMPDNLVGRNTPILTDGYESYAIDQIETWEERAIVSRIDFQKSEINGKLEPKVVLTDGE